MGSLLLCFAMAKAMKAMKAMAAMKAMKAMKKKPVSAKLAKRHAFFGKIDKTASGLKKSDLVQNKNGKIVSKKKAAAAKSTFVGWISAVAKARKALNINGFAAAKKGTPLYKKAKELYQ